MRISEMVVLGCLLSTAASAESGNRIRVRVQDYAGVSPKRLAEAFAIAGEILHGANVSAVWLDCSPNANEAMDAGCGRRPDAQDIVLRLMPEKMAAATGLKTACLGFAVLPSGDYGTLAAVFVDKARSKAERALASRSAVLGHAIAHEIGHLLIGEAQHAPRGLMQAVWSRSTLLRATALPMELSGAEKEAIAINIRGRAIRARHSAAR